MIELSKIQDIIIAGAIGDSIGELVRERDWKTFKRKYGEAGIKVSHMKQWHISSVTQMSMFCLYGAKELFENGDPRPVNAQKSLYNAYLEWAATQTPNKTSSIKLGTFAKMKLSKNPSKVSLDALNSGKMGTISRPINNSKESSCVSRAGTLGFIKAPYSRIFKIGADQAALTHGHPDAYLSAGCFAVIMNGLLLGNMSTIAPYLDACTIELAKYKGSDNVAHMIHRVKIALLNKDKHKVYRHDKLTDNFGEGWVGDTALGAALYCYIQAKSFEDVIDLAVNHSGNSSVIGSMAAQLYVAKNGLPDEYSDMQTKFDVKLALKNLFFEVRKMRVIWKRRLYLQKYKLSVKSKLKESNE